MSLWNRYRRWEWRSFQKSCPPAAWIIEKSIGHPGPFTRAERRGLADPASFDRLMASVDNRGWPEAW